MWRRGVQDAAVDLSFDRRVGRHELLPRWPLAAPRSSRRRINNLKRIGEDGPSKMVQIRRYVLPSKEKCDSMKDPRAIADVQRRAGNITMADLVLLSDPRPRSHPGRRPQQQ